MNRVTYSLAIALAAMYSLASNAQQDLVNRMMPKPVPASPNAASLGKFGDYQVSHFNGLPDISIPLYEVQSGSLKLPITLSYHASGIKPTDVASWVGAGWSLSAGGQISRSIVGKPDEMGFLSAPLNASPSNCNTFYYLLNSATNVSDTEPDIFNYSIGGTRGKFIWTYSSGPYLVPYSPIKVAATSSGFGSFEITNIDGVVHRFGQSGQTANLESTTATSGGNPSTSGTTAWLQDGMFAPNSDDAITITHQQVGTFNTHDISYSYVVIDECNAQNGASCPANSFIPQQHNIDSYGLQKGPSVINFETGKVKFIMSTSNRSDAPNLKYLDRIEIHGLDDVKRKTIQFVYSYFTNAVGGNAALKLDAVQFKDSLNTIINQYTFSYFTNSFSWNPGSANFLNARDLWGYYNGATGNTDLLLPQTISFQQLYNTTPVPLTFGGALNRAVNTTYVKEGVLKKINFPTGGYTEFDYESNRYLNASTPTNAGGLRVTKVTTSDGTAAPPIVKTYKYGSGESGLGTPNFSEQQFSYSNRQLSINESCGVSTPSLRVQIRTFQSNTSFAFESSPVVYNYVTEYTGDPLGSVNGKITYIFDNGVSSMDVNHVVPQSSKSYRNSYAWKRGKLTNKTVYDKNNNKLSETNIVHTLHKDEARYIGLGSYLFKPQFVTGCENACLNEASEQVHPDALFFTQFFQNTGAMLETSVVETNYENGNVNNYVSTTTSNVYDADKVQRLQSTMSRSTSAEERVNINVYPCQFSAIVNASSTGAAKGIYMLNNKNIVNSPLESYTYVQNSGGTNQRVISSQLTTYRTNVNNTNHVVPDQVFLFESAQPLLKSLFVPMTINGTNNGINKDTRYKERLTFDNYDAVSNILQVSKTKDAPISYLYGYNNTLPIAEIKNARNSPGVVEFKLEGFEDSAVAGVVTSTTNSQTGIKYFNGDYTISFTKPNTRSYVIEYYYFDSATSKWVFISKNYTGPTMALTEGTRIDNIRIRPVDSAMTTYTYNQLNGITSISDPNHVTSFFRYDPFGRLQFVKDHAGNVVSTNTYHYYKQ